MELYIGELYVLWILKVLDLNKAVIKTAFKYMCDLNIGKLTKLILLKEKKYAYLF